MQPKDAPFSRKHIHDHSEDIEGHINNISSEFREGFALLKKYPKSVSIFGSSMATPQSSHYHKAEELGKRIVRELKYAVITGGGPGIMEAANKGAQDAGGPSVGLNISLPHNHEINKYENDSMRFDYFFSRKVMLAFAAEAYIFFPGGYGTFDELFGILTLIQTGKIPRVPIFLFDSGFWKGMKTFMEHTLLKQYGTIDSRDFELFTITDSMDNVIDAIRNAPVSDWWRKIN